MPNDLLEQLSALLNLPDLIIIAAVLVNMILGFRRGFFGSLYGLVGRIIALAASYFAARAAAPYIASWVVTPIVGDVFEQQATLSVSSGVLDALRQTVTEAAQSMAESIAFLLLLILFGILFGWLVGVLTKSLRFIAHLTPLGILDSVAGGAVGFATGVILIALILVGIQFFSPITYSSLGWLSPERVSNTVLLARLIDILPVAI
ncbi:CvpA family protein [Agathobaculum sp.]|uniref:CvpA family protein n=1 Tax=Agathobaculum sp. TaxID=2048138 RepID=UPI0027BAEE53|nr:CvpA family protein [Agathobaculum sp.]MBS6640871.1 CvpA family protein [Clostridiaceae bacterium]